MLENFFEKPEVCDIADNNQFMLTSNLDDENDSDEEQQDQDIDKGGKTDA